MQNGVMQNAKHMEELPGSFPVAARNEKEQLPYLIFFFFFFFLVQFLYSREEK